MVALRSNTSDAAEEPRNAAMRSLARPQAQRFTRSFLRGTYPVDLKTPAGLVVGRTAGYDVDFNRLDRVSSRTARGLFFRQFGRRLSDDFEAVSFAREGLPIEKRREIANFLLGRVDRTEPREIGDGVFEYWYHADPDVPDSTVWVFRFYRSTEFIVFTVPRDQVRDKTLGPSPILVPRSG